ncbi:MAG: hypothetical protein HN341_15875 [Verrucomicrobia bacterium]|nr:hypothetical protein [Verrucomicrobiota bacterium]
MLDCDAAHDVLRGIWTRSAERNGWYVGDYVLMPEHVHFFARACSGADRMGRWVSMWKSVSSRALMKREEVSAPVWQSDYFDRYLRSGESYGEKWLYVEQNPVRAGLVTDAEQWPYRGRIHRLGG